MHFIVPKTSTQVHSFIGCTSYYRCFIEIFSKIAFPLFQLLTKDAEFLWIDVGAFTTWLDHNVFSLNPVVEMLYKGRLRVSAC